MRRMAEAGAADGPGDSENSLTIELSEDEERRCTPIAVGNGSCRPEPGVMAAVLLWLTLSHPRRVARRRALFLLGDGLRI